MTVALHRYLAPIMPYLNKSYVTEVCLNEPKALWVESKQQFTRYDVPELTQGFVEALAGLIAEFNHKAFPTPLLGGSLPNGERIQIVMRPACSSVAFAIRRHHMKDLSLDAYEQSGAFHITNNQTVNDEQLQSLHAAQNYLAFIKHAILAKKNILISGGTGTGKTTFLNACLKVIPAHERLITVEDAFEVQVSQPNHVRLLFDPNQPAMNAAQVFKSCLRLRPDRIFLSELRADEVWSFLRAANSGHPGSLSTIHADSPAAAFEQLIFMMQQAGSTSTHQQLMQYIKSIIHIVVQLQRGSNGRFVHVSEIYYQ